MFPSENWNAPGGFRVKYRAEGPTRTLPHGTTLALVGVSDGAGAYEMTR